ncbi:hypothetical protein ACHAWO_003376 [Cyclotella atomus]|uniref:Uncharacterized protein n=1 Tax=Cyclotella atomus TaxID=382360 RepID=A0ABD3QXA2_9STRA
MSFKIRRLVPCSTHTAESKRQLAAFQKELDQPIRPPSRRIRSVDSSENEYYGIPSVISCRMTADSSERSDDRR